MRLTLKLLPWLVPTTALCGTFLTLLILQLVMVWRDEVRRSWYVSSNMVIILDIVYVSIVNVSFPFIAQGVQLITNCYCYNEIDAVAFVGYPIFAFESISYLLSFLLVWLFTSWGLSQWNILCTYYRRTFCIEPNEALSRWQSPCLSWIAHNRYCFVVNFHLFTFFKVVLRFILATAVL